MPGVIPDGRDWTRERHPRAASACACEEIRDHSEDREGGETGARHSLLARLHSDLSIDFHDRSRTVRERTSPTNERTWKGERGTQPPRISAARHEFQTGAARAIHVPQGCLKERPSRGCRRPAFKKVQRLLLCLRLPFDFFFSTDSNFPNDPCEY